MTEYSDAQKAAAFEWLRYLPDRQHIGLNERDRKQAEVALSAWVEAERLREQMNEAHRILCEASWTDPVPEDRNEDQLRQIMTRASKWVQAHNALTTQPASGGEDESRCPECGGWGEIFRGEPDNERAEQCWTCEGRGWLNDSDDHDDTPSSDAEDVLQRVAEDMLDGAESHSLDPEDERILYENRHELYETSDDTPRATADEQPDTDAGAAPESEDPIDMLNDLYYASHCEGFQLSADEATRLACGVARALTPERVPEAVRRLPKDWRDNNAEDRPIGSPEQRAYKDACDDCATELEHALADSGQCVPDGLSFHALRNANVRRCESAFHPLHHWNPMEWGAACAGEVGEGINAAKKLRRMQDSEQYKQTLPTTDVTLQDVADEIADTVIYADLWAASIGVDLGAAVADKFNRTSQKVQSDITLAAARKAEDSNNDR